MHTPEGSALEVRETVAADEADRWLNAARAQLSELGAAVLNAEMEAELEERALLEASSAPDPVDDSPDPQEDLRTAREDAERRIEQLIAEAHAQAAEITNAARDAAAAALLVRAGRPDVVDLTVLLPADAPLSTAHPSTQPLELVAEPAAPAPEVDWVEPSPAVAALPDEARALANAEFWRDEPRDLRSFSPLEALLPMLALVALLVVALALIG